MSSERLWCRRRPILFKGSVANRGDNIVDMIQELDLLAAKVRELALTIQSLRADNQELRSQLGAARQELEAMSRRVDEAAQRLDGLIQRLPASGAASVPWNT
ncbi:MAG: hypothetical protein ACREBN_01530 [Burkholderiaceae bacterium]